MGFLAALHRLASITACLHVCISVVVCLCGLRLCVCLCMRVYESPQCTIGVTVHHRYLLHYLTFCCFYSFVLTYSTFCLWANIFQTLFIYFVVTEKCFLSCFFILFISFSFFFLFCLCNNPNGASISQPDGCCRGCIVRWIYFAYRDISALHALYTLIVSMVQGAKPIKGIFAKFIRQRYSFWVIFGHCLIMLMFFQQFYVCHTSIYKHYFPH